jgi:outer membrane receptor for ferric coprogen and ferric-rhodotorulic acid
MKASLSQCLIATAMLASMRLCAAEPSQLDVPAGNLVSALKSLAAQTDVELVYRAEQLKDLRTEGVKGAFSPQEAIAILLKGTALQVHTAASGAMVIAPAPAPDQTSQLQGDSLEQIVVTGSALWMGKAGETPREVPQSVSVLSRKRIEDQNLESLGDALDATTGITTQRSSSLFANFYSRGFNITNLQLDGGASLDRSLGYGNVLPDMAQFERVEVLRGADGLFSGAGEPGGRVNMVRKRPTSQPQAQASLSAGRWNTYQGQLDLSGPLAFEGKLRGRAVTSLTDQGYFFDGAKDGRKALVYAIVDAALTPSTMLTVGGSYEDQNLPYFAYGLPRYSTGADLHLSRDTYLSPAWSYYKSTVKTGFAGLEQGMGRWSLKLDLHYLTQDEDRSGVNYYFAIDPQTDAGGSSLPSRQLGSVEQKSADLAINGPLELFGREHTVVIGANWQQAGIESLNQSATGPVYAMGNVFTYQPSAYARPSGFPPPGSSYVPEITQSGIYGMIRFQVLDPLKVMIGGRVSKYEFESVFTDLVSNKASVNRYEDSGVFTPYGGIVYDLSSRWSLYTSIGETYSSQSGSLKGPLPGTPLDPIAGRNYELGVKGELGDGVSFTSAVYRIERKGEAVQDLSYPPTSVGQVGASCCYLDDGEVVSEGIDTEITSELFHGLTLTAGYTYNDNQDKLAGTGRAHSRTPRHLFKSFGTYLVPHTQNKLRVGGGVTFQSDNYASGAVAAYDQNGNPLGVFVPYEFRQGGYSLWSLFGEYKINEQLSAALNVSNLFDKTYYSTIGVSGYGNWYGEPRNVTVTVRARF